ncbi:MAG: hypothetical protein RIC55_35475 [Pirellulaceae bacterium]
MSSKRNWIWLSAIIACASIAPGATAQDFTPFLAQGEFSPSGSTAPYTSPYDGDWQFFTPFEESDFGFNQGNRDGFFFNYDRCYWNVSAPAVTMKADGDFGWGNRFDVGYMTPGNAGWMFEALQMHGPNVSNNSSEMAGFEFDRMFRMQSFDNGITLTPDFAIRYISIIDRTVPFGVQGDQGTAAPTKNNIIGGQIGMKGTFRKGPWQVSANGKLLAAENFQVFTNYIAVGNQLADGPGASRREFVPGGELRFDASYFLTRDIALNFGWEMLYLGRGIARAQQLNANDDRMVYNGAVFGFTYNRPN